MPAIDKVLGRDGLHRSRLHDEKGQMVSVPGLLGFPASFALRASQKFTDRPYLPWVPFPVIRRFRAILRADSSRVLEFGSGRSTRWFAAHAREVVSIEDHQAWFEKMSSIFAEARLDNIDYRWRVGPAYYDLSDVDGEFDLVVVDGTDRGECLPAASGRVRPGGWIYLDNSDKDMLVENGDVRRAEGELQRLATQWGTDISYFVGYPPGNFYPHEGALLQRPG